MSTTAWKQFERDMAAIFKTTRFKANTGDRLDFANAYVVGQCKMRKNLSLESLTQLAEEMDAQAGHKGKLFGVVCVKVRRGQGKQSQPLIVMTADTFKKWKEFYGAT